MTKHALNEILNSAYVDALKQYTDPAKLKEILSSYGDSDTGKISTDELALFVLMESIKINREILKSVLESVLEFDD